MMFDYGNSLGNAWILKSRMEKVNRDFKKQMGQAGAVEKAALFWDVYFPAESRLPLFTARQQDSPGLLPG